jgi:transmembrane sensor
MFKKKRDLATAEHIQELYEKYLVGQCSPTETRYLMEVFVTEDSGVLAALIHQKLMDEQAIAAETEGDAQRYERILRKLQQEITGKQQPAGMQWWKIAAVAFLTLAAGFSGYFYLSKPDATPALVRTKVKTDVKPGGNKAYLILANGQKIALAEVATGLLTTSTAERIRKTADGEIRYEGEGGVTARAGALNVLQTPKGGQYSVVLPDGTQVWLNAASSISYSASFRNLQERKIHLKGEAYFEVAKDPTRPFIVQTDDQQIKVLGTHFNVNAYHDQGGSATTLLEGSIRATAGTAFALVRPGQQVLTHGNQHLKITKADTELAIAWKNDQFMFDSMPLKVLMENLARWYDVEIVYTADLPDVHFNGSVSKFENISVVLKILASTGKVHFKMEGRTIHVNR